MEHDDPGRAQAGRAVDESRRYLRRQAPQAVEDDDPDPGDHARPPTSSSASSGPTAPNVLWVADITYLRTGEGWLYLAAVQDAYSRQIVGWSMATHMRASLVVDALQDGARAPTPGPRADPPLRPRLAIRQPGVRARRRRGRDRGLDGLPRRRVRQRRRRDVLRDAQERARQPPHLAVPARAAVRRVRVHRGVLQPPAPPLHPRDALPGQPTNNYDSRRSAVEINRWNNNNQQTNPVSRKPGQVQPAFATARFVRMRKSRAS